MRRVRGGDVIDDNTSVIETSLVIYTPQTHQYITNIHCAVNVTFDMRKPVSLLMNIETFE